MAPFLVELFNRSLSNGIVPDIFKAAYITPLLKKPDADPDDVKNYRPISNLTVLSKLLERLVAKQLLDYLTTSRLLPDLQSAYRAYHSTEKAVLKVLSDILLAVDKGDLAMLTLLDLSAAFDTVDHTILLRRLRTSYGLRGSVHDWFSSYLRDRTQQSARPLRIEVAISTDQSPVRRSTGVGPWTDPVFVIHRRPDPAGPESLSVSALVRGRHAGVWILSTLCSGAASESCCRLRRRRC